MTLPPLHIPELLKQYHIRPKKSLGQNFLADHNALLKILRAAEIGPNDDVLEIGAGLGNLTRFLAHHGASVTAVEIDAHLFPVLQYVTQAFDNVQLVKGDILEIPPAALFSNGGYKVVANIPYYITSAILRHLLEAEIQPSKIVLTIQREVAERILNRDEKMSLLSLSVQIYGEAHIAAHIPAACFYPEPQVDSSVLAIDIYDDPKLSRESIPTLFQIAHAAFRQKRKMLRNSLKPVFNGNQDALSAALSAAGIDVRRRPETLSLEEWINLTQSVMAVPPKEKNK
jgi:16S rRNA (adenine1518-N6/adenine1519-N6)-dimethyltransferase